MTPNLTDQDVDDIARVLCWLKNGGTPPAAQIEHIVQRNAELRGIVDDMRARAAVPDGKQYHDVAQRLYSLLDDIDTAGDVAKSDDKLYRGIVERTQAKKRDYVVSCDGYAAILADDSVLAASKEAK